VLPEAATINSDANFDEEPVHGMAVDKEDDEVSVNLSEADLNAPINRIASVNIV
jgi:hypothetical protein